MSFLGREGAPFSEELWDKIDETVTSTAKSVLTGRRFVPVAQAEGAGQQFAKIDRASKVEEMQDWYIKTNNRQVVEIPQLYADFWLYWRDIEADGKNIETASIASAAQKLARHEDEMIFYGIQSLGLEGLLTVKGSGSVKKGDWSKGEHSFADVAAAVDALEQKSYSGSYNLILSSDLYLNLQRIQEGTGMLESYRIQKFIGGSIIKSTVLKNNTALLVYSEPYCMDLLIGQDIKSAYLESVDMNHHLRVTETALLRVKCPDSIVVFK